MTPPPHVPRRPTGQPSNRRSDRGDLHGGGGRIRPGTGCTPDGDMGAGAWRGAQEEAASGSEERHTETEG